MDFIDRLFLLQKKITCVGQSLLTEEATKNALVMPFLHNVLGYDVFDPAEVVPEFTADVGIKKGEKVDYAIFKDGKLQILVECKNFSAPLSTKHSGQLFRYFSVTNARVAILTNGSEYQFYTDLDEPNKMDENPFLVLDLSDIDEHVVPEVKKLTKQSFDLESIVDAAGELKYLNSIKKLIAAQFSNPGDDFVKLFAAQVYPGIITAKVKLQFTDLTKKALGQFMNDSINSRLKSAISGSGIEQPQKLIDPTPSAMSNEDEKAKVVTTPDEVDGYNIVRSILRQIVPVHRIVCRDTQSYFGILLDDNNRKPLARLYFNSKQKYLGVFDKDKNETKVPLENLDQIFEYSEALVLGARSYLD